MKSLRVPARPEELDGVTSFVMGEIETCGCSPRTRYQIELAIEEIFVNISNYAYAPGEGDVEILCGILRDPLRAEIRFLDSGEPFDPLAREKADTSPESFMERAGGLGIFLVTESMDDVRYAYENGKNVLTIVKKL